MRPPCEIIVKDILPAFRALIARNLIEKYGFTQVEVAKKLGTTQPVISYYLSLRRGRKKLTDLESNTFIKDVIDRIVQDIVENKVDFVNLTSTTCYICKAIKNKPEFTKL
jgi:predicted transcriptional regulator